MEIYRNKIKETATKLLIDLNDIVILNLNGNLTDDYTDYKSELVGQKDAIEMLLDTAGVYYDMTPNLHNKLELIDDILAAQNEDSNQLEVIRLVLTYIEDRATFMENKLEVKLSEESYSVLEGAIIDYIVNEFLEEDEANEFYKRLEDIAFSSGIIKAYTVDGVERVNAAVKEVISKTSYDELSKDNVNKYINMIKSNRTSAEVYGCEDKVIRETKALLDELEDILNNLC